MPGIEIEGLSKRFGRVQALDRVSLRISRGTIVALVGPNGSGKSTLLRIMGTVVLPDSGRVRVAGHDVVVDPLRARRSVGVMLGDERSLYWRISGRRNLEFFAALHRMRRAEAAARAAALLRELGLSEVADRPVSGYSSGMRVKLSLARALLGEPSVLLLDEPTNSLDPVAAGRLRELIASLARERDATVLMATHNPGEASTLAERVIGLSAGRLAFDRPAGGDPKGLEAALAEVTG